MTNVPNLVLLLAGVDVVTRAPLLVVMCVPDVVPCVILRAKLNVRIHPVTLV